MPLIEDIADPLGYYDESWHQAEFDPHEVRTFAEALEASIEIWKTPLIRWPVRNREPRTPIDSQKRAIIHDRDGYRCRMCGEGDTRLTVDHIIPRSAFPENQLHIADRSDNLISACWPCNEGKSNYEYPQSKCLGVVVKCWDCLHPEYDPDDYLDELADEAWRPDMPIPAYCGRCGITQVPAVIGWIL